MRQLKTVSVMLKNFAEVVAIVVAWWAYDHFWKPEAPSLPERFKSKWGFVCGEVVKKES